MLVDVSSPVQTIGPGGRALAAYQRLANRPWLGCLIPGILSLVLRAALLPWLPIPQPSIHDEFSYLLAADTYASGRLTNPPHPMWKHFESFHIIQQPMYASKYPPMQGLVLAFGQRFFHQPWIGVLLSVGLMCSAVCWMLRVWIAPPWALLGGLVMLTQWGVSSYWMNSYWGGAVPAIGGALVLGALPRIARDRRFGQSILFALGLVILMASRPYEGLALGVSASTALVWWLWRSRVPAGLSVRCVAAPVLAVLFVAGSAVAYQNYRVTGHPLELPYQVHDRQYAAATTFRWAPLRTDLTYRHAAMRDFWVGYEAHIFQEAARKPFDTFFIDTAVMYVLFFGFFPLAAVVSVWPFRLRPVEEKLTLALLAASFVAVIPLMTFLPHYFAPVAGLLYLRLLQGSERLVDWRPGGKPAGLILTMILFGVIFFQLPVSLMRTLGAHPSAPNFAQNRAAVIQTLSREPGRQLVIVRYRPDHDVHHEWVYNRADIDGAAIVWAREMGGEDDRALVRYFQDRRAWLLEPDGATPKLTLYPAP
jgi:hypothetical protein